MTDHIHEVYECEGVYSCIYCPKQFTREEMNNMIIQLVGKKIK